MSTRANGLTDPADGLTVSAAVSVQRQQETVSAATTGGTAASPGTVVGTLGGSTDSNNLSSALGGPASQSTIGTTSGATLRQPIAGSTEPPTIASSQGGAPNVSASPTATPTPGAPADVPCEEGDSPLYCVYTVAEGDNLGIIASKFNIKGNDDVTSWELLVQSNRPDIVSEDDLLQIGQKLRIPLYSGVVHTVLSAQTLGEIADRYGVEPEDIIGVSANGISNANAISIGKELIIPNPTRFTMPVAAVAPTPSSGSSGSGGSTDSGGTTGSTGAARNSNTGPRSSAGMMWPTTGPISSYYGPSHPLGIDVDLFNNPNAPIGSAAAGTVTFAGGNACCSYGYYVVVDHGNGITTLYAHFSAIYVSVGESVAAGEILGAGGRTGYATGNHLHFEVHVGGSIVNPLDYLP